MEAAAGAGWHRPLMHILANAPLQELLSGQLDSCAIQIALASCKTVVHHK